MLDVCMSVTTKKMVFTFVALRFGKVLNHFFSLRLFRHVMTMRKTREPYFFSFPFYPYFLFFLPFFCPVFTVFSFLLLLMSLFFSVLSSSFVLLDILFVFLFTLKLLSIPYLRPLISLFVLFAIVFCSFVSINLR